MGLRSSVSAACALALLVCGSDAWAGPCTGGNCPAANFVVTGIVSPQSAGTMSSVTVEVRTSAGVRATGYTGTIHFTSTDGQAVLPANYTFTGFNFGIAFGPPGIGTTRTNYERWFPDACPVRGTQ